MPMQALILLVILAASAVVFTVIFVIVADRELAKPEPDSRQETEPRDERGESEEDRRGDEAPAEEDRS